MKLDVIAGSTSVEFAMRLVQLMISKLSLDTINSEYSSELAMMVSLNYRAILLICPMLSKFIFESFS